ncbi:MAG: hypothetical protein ACR2P1_13880, partial [Pseudomonadales bacterium]
DLNEAGTDAANEPENEADTDTSNEGGNEIHAEVEVNSAIIDAESDADSDETTHSYGLESANTAACVTEVDLHGVADHDAEIDDSEIEGLDEDTADSQLPAYSQSHS